MSELELITTREFDGFTLDCYVEPNQDDKSKFWATREQIGTLLGYSDPRVSVSNIHQRNKERLDKFSTVIKLITVEGGREVNREVTVYNFKGLLEICRYSNQPNANAVIDILWDIADEIRKTGSYNVHEPDTATETQRLALDLERAKFLQHIIDAPAFPLTDESKAVIQHEAFKLVTGHEYLGMLPVSTEKWYTAGEIGDMFGISANLVGRIAKKHNIKAPDGESNKYGRWIFSKSKYSSREVPSFIYSEDAVEWFRDYQDGLLKEA